MIKSVTITMLKLFAWKIKGNLPSTDKFILLGAPHTSNWDFVLMLFVSIFFNRKFYWMGKDTLFRPPFRKLFESIGGIPVDRKSRNNAVQTVVERFKVSKSMILVITPEGTRKKVVRWKTGFYHIAIGAGVPIVFGYVDYKKKEVGIGPVFLPTGNIKADFNTIELFYRPIAGKFREKAGAISPD